MGKISKRRIGKECITSTRTPLPCTVPRSEWLSDNKRRLYEAITNQYFRRIDTNVLAHTARAILMNQIDHYNIDSSKYERDGIYRSFKFMEKSLERIDRKWYRVNVPADVPLQFFDGEDSDGNTTFRNMPLRKKRRKTNRKAIDEALEYLKQHPYLCR